MVNKHIAQSGIKKGQWVECSATQRKCRLTPQNNHTTDEELQRVQKYVLVTTGKRIDRDSASLEDVARYRILSDEQKQAVEEASEPVHSVPASTEPVEMVWEDSPTSVNPTRKFEMRQKEAPLPSEKEPKIERIVCKVDTVKTDFMSYKLLEESLDVLEKNGCKVSYTAKRRLLTVRVKDLEIDGDADVVSQWQDWVTEREATPKAKTES
jgi:hypothetical protein